MTDKNKEEILSETRLMERLTDPEDPKERNESLSQTRVIERLTDETRSFKAVTPDYDDDPDDSEEDSERKKSAAKEVVSFIRDLVVCMIVVILFTNFIARPVQVKGRSMYPTLEDSSVGFSNVIGLSTDGLERFDIAIIYIEDKDEYIVKRVIGLPGETVSYVNGQLYINDVPIDEDFLDEDYIREIESSGLVFMEDVSPVTLGEDEYFCLGDNRPHSTDSRYYGAFHINQIKAKGVMIFWPFSRFGVQTW